MTVKCSKSNWCKPMNDRLQHANAHAKGLSTVLIMSLKKGSTELLAGVAYKDSPKDRGLMLNFCPWCGTDLRPMMEMPK